MRGCGNIFIIGMLMTVMMTPLLEARSESPENLNDQTHFWLGLELGRFGGGDLDDVVGAGFHISTQFSRKTYFSLYGFGASRWFSEGDTIGEYGILVGLCKRSRRTFVGASAGIAAVNTNINSNQSTRSISLPMRLEFSVILGGFIAAGIKFHGTLTEDSYFGVMIGIELGKMR